MKRLLAIILTVVISGTFFLGCGKKKETLTWALFNMRGDQQVYLDALNEALEEKKLPYRFSFSNISIPFEGDYKAYVAKYVEEVKNGGFDLVSCPGIQNCYDTYKWMADENLLEPLNDFLEQEESGKTLKAAYPSVVWDSLDYNGDIYGVLTPVTDLNYYAVFQADYAEKYGIDISSATFQTMEESMRKALEGEAGNPDFVISTPWPYIKLNGGESSPCEMVCIRKEQGGWRAESILEDEESRAHLELVNEWGKQGLIAEGDYSGALSSGNFLMTGCYSYSEDGAVQQVRSIYGIPQDIELEAREFPEFGQRFKGNGFKTAVMAGSSQKEKALEALAAIYSEGDLSDALVYGKEGESYQLVDGHAEFLGGYDMSGNARLLGLGNPFLTTPSYKEPLDKKEVLWDFIEKAPVSELMKNNFDLEGIDEQISQINVAFLEGYQPLLYGLTEDVQGDLNRLMNDMEALGLSEVIEGLNEQLKGFEV